ncbi:MAG: acetyl-CoA carboxylase biotin carboxylase subunit [Anaerolineales bacterium]|nr:acetyl-CoA carboxylase biotin carboxylase subunit [Anaerolineales bacterium]
MNKVLVANRGEIAVRVLRACRELGLKTVAVYSDVDRKSLHVRYADEAYPIGPAPSAQSYLRMESLIEAANKSGAEAIHPGYGFLSENADFAQMCADEGILFVGPRPDAIRRMGDKGIARSTMKAAGVPVVPGTEGLSALSDEELLAEAEKIGFPLLIKAAAGGGGKGMRAVNNLAEMPVAIGSARRESKSAFGDDNVYLEKMIEGARHIEVQILADQHGNVVHLGERECSIQRRHQKLIEEAPSPFVGVDQTFRDELCRVGVLAAQAVDYVNAGTVECLVDKDKNFYFLEMNTRLQVEHPVTELVTGVDIVVQQLRIARGEQLSFQQEDVAMRGWAVECRINAEDPFNQFFPSTGLIRQHDVPTGPGVRVDTGVFSGAEITPYYDPMIAKLVCYGDKRSQALRRMRRALAEYHILGVTSNIPFHQNILQNNDFIAGNFDTSFVEKHFSLDQTDPSSQKHAEAAAIIATLLSHAKTQRAARIDRDCGERVSAWKRARNWKEMGR